MFSDFLTRLSPIQPETGMIGTESTLYPTDLMSFSPFSLADLNASSEYLLVSILLIAMINWLTPNVFNKNACSLAWPPGATAVSVSPSLAESTKTAQSASEAPVIMFLIKSRCPGASINVKKYFGVSNF